MSEYDIYYRIGAYKEDDSSDDYDIVGIKSDYISIFELTDIEGNELFSDRNIISKGVGQEYENYRVGEKKDVIKYDVSEYIPPEDGGKINLKASVKPLKNYTYSYIEQEIDETNFDSENRLTLDSYVQKKPQYSIAVFDTPISQINNYTRGVESSNYSNIKFTKNINLKIVPYNDELEEVDCIYTSSNSFSFNSDVMRIGSTDLVEHTKNKPETVDIEMKLSDIWEYGETITNRDKELEKLNAIYRNNEMVKIISNISNIIYNKPSSDKDSINISKDFIITDMNVTQGNKSKNVYNCSLSLKKVNFAEYKIYDEYPSSVSSSDLTQGDDDGITIDLEKWGEEGDIYDSDYTQCALDEDNEPVKRLPFDENADFPQRYTVDIGENTYNITYKVMSSTYQIKLIITDMDGEKLYSGMIKECNDCDAAKRDRFGKISGKRYFSFRVFKWTEDKTDIRVLFVYN